MRQIHLTSGNTQDEFLPLTYINPFSDLLFGTQTIGARWQKFAVASDMELVMHAASENLASTVQPIEQIPFASSTLLLDSPWAMLQHNAVAISADESIFHSQEGYMMNPANLRKTGQHNLIVHESARVEDCHFHTGDGPIIIAENAHLMCGSAFRGPIYIGPDSVVKMGATIYGGTTIGPHCTIGGEVKNSIFHGYANKGHHGYIGDSHIGLWCNLGAGTSCSNVKNTAGSIKYWHISKQEFKKAGPKAGVLMGDHVKTAINTALNSGTVIGIFANVFDCQSLSPKYIPAFSWGGQQPVVYDPAQFKLTLTRWQQMKGIQSTENEINTIVQLYHQINQQ